MILTRGKLMKRDEKWKQLSENAKEQIINDAKDDHQIVDCEKKRVVIKSSTVGTLTSGCGSNMKADWRCQQCDSDRGDERSYNCNFFFLVAYNNF